jgi:hypothetical protein
LAFICTTLNPPAFSRPSSAGRASAGVLLEIVHQDGAFAELVDLGHHGFHDLVRRARLEVEGVEVAGKHRDVAGAEIRNHWPAGTRVREPYRHAD